MTEQNCEHCAFPLNETAIQTLHFNHTELQDEDHYGGAILTCNHCSGKVLHYWVEIFDDMWHYWAPLPEQEAENLKLSVTGDQDMQTEIISFLQARHVLCRFPDRTLKYCEGAYQIFSGPPW